MTDKGRISIQVCLSGYSFKIESDDRTRSSGWLSPDHIFTAKELQSRYGTVEISLFTPKCTLVPAHFFDPPAARELLAGVVEIGEDDIVEHIEEPFCGGVMVFSRSIGETLSKVIADTVLTYDGKRARVLPELHFMLKALETIPDYNRIVASYADGRLHLVVSQGRTLQLCNTFEAADFTTAEYFIFHVLKRLQLNPEISPIYFRTPLDHEQELSLYRYFKDVVQI